MLGADVGTALMAQVFSLDLRWLSPLLIFFGVVFFLSRKNTRAGQLGPRGDRPGPHHPRAAAGDARPPQPITQAQGVKVIFASLSGDLHARHADRRGLHHPLVVEPRGRAARRRPSSPPSVISVPGGAVPGAGRQPGQRPAGAAREPAARPAPDGAWRSATCIFKVVGCLIFAIALPWVHRAASRASTPTRAARCSHFHVALQRDHRDRSSSASPIRSARLVTQLRARDQRRASAQIGAAPPRRRRARDAGAGARQRRARDAAHRRHRRADAERHAAGDPHQRRARWSTR